MSRRIMASPGNNAPGAEDGVFVFKKGGMLPDEVPGETYRVLLAVSIEPLAHITKEYLERPGLLDITLVSSGNEALEVVTDQVFDVIVSDYDLSDMDAIAFHLLLQDHHVNIPFLLLTITDRDRKMLDERVFSSNPGIQVQNDIATIFNDQSQKIVQTVELFRTRNRLELYTKHLEELVEERTRQLQTAQRLAVIGELATMIGHDMRNPLQVITNMQYLLDRKIGSMSSEEVTILKKYGIFEIFERIGSETHYLNKIVTDLRDYAGEVNLEKVTINPGVLLDNILDSLSFPPNISIQRQYEPGITMAVDPHLISRVLSNVIMNAVQAMEDGGDLTLITSQSDGTISIVVSDTGVGIREQDQSHIFEPLFTTKSKGTGLGLSVTKRLIEVHGGTINLKHTSSNGTTFEVQLPALDNTQGDIS